MPSELQIIFLKLVIKYFHLRVQESSRFSNANFPQVSRKQNLYEKLNSKIQSEQGADEDENRTRDRRRRGAESPLEPVALPGLCGVFDHVGDVALLLHAHEQVRHWAWKVVRNNF